MLNTIERRLLRQLQTHTRVHPSDVADRPYLAVPVLLRAGLVRSRYAYVVGPRTLDWIIRQRFPNYRRAR